MSRINNPAIQQFVAELGSGAELGQVWVTRDKSGFYLRHLADRNLVSDSLRPLSMSDLRTLAQFTANGAFRPLKSAPNLRRGWLMNISDEQNLAIALDELYPNFVADWFAARSPIPPITNYREFTARQTGMYRIAAMLSDEQLAPVIVSCCHRDFCLKRRLWTNGDLGLDPATEKSGIPCLEPCALLLEFARKSMRIEQANRMEVALSEADWSTIRAALEIATDSASSEIREADFNSAANPRRLRLTLEKLKPKLPKLAAEEGD